MKVYIVRHGQTDWNVQCKIQGQTDIPLNKTGKVQAEELAEKLKDIGFQAIITSPLLRAKETAEIINKHHNVPIVTHEMAMERHFGVLEGGHNSRDITFRFYHKNIKIENGESTQEFTKRIFKFMDEVVNEYKDKCEAILLTSHGGVMRSIYWYFEGLPIDDNEDGVKLFDNCEVLEYEV